MAALDDLADELEDNAVVGGSTDWDIHLGILPDDETKAVAIFEDTGGEPDNQTEDTNQYDRPHFDVLIRGDVYEYSAARTKAQEVSDQLHDATITGWNYIYAKGTPVLHSWDRNNRPILQVGFHAMRVRTA